MKRTMIGTIAALVAIACSGCLQMRGDGEAPITRQEAPEVWTDHIEEAAVERDGGPDWQRDSVVQRVVALSEKLE
ncbi:hypothetical protein LCGC14_2807890, partial [marine sediment metagenome]